MPMPPRIRDISAWLVEVARHQLDAVRQRLLELVPVGAAHVRAHVQVALADRGRDLDHVEVVTAARDEAGPVARAHERLLALARAVLRHQRFGIARETLAHGADT